MLNTQYYVALIALGTILCLQQSTNARLVDWDNNQLPLQESPDSTRGAITPEVSSYIQDLIRDNGVPGLSLGVVRLSGNGTIYTEYGAWGNATEDHDPVTPQTLFHIGSCGKAFLSASLGILMEDFASGKNATPLPPGVTSFSWDTKIADLLRDDPSGWKLQDEWANAKANVRDILSHVTGLPDHDLSYGPGHTTTTFDIVKRMKYLKPSYELREKYQYNNQMFMLGSYILTKFAGEPTSSFVQKRIFDPLNMTSSTFSSVKAKENGLSHSFASEGRRIPFWFHEEWIEVLSGAGGVFSNTIDITKWLAMLLNKGVDPLTNTTIIPRSAFEAVTSAHVVQRGTGISRALIQDGFSGEYSIAGYGTGWGRWSDRGHEIVAHTGGLPGFLTIVEFLPHDNLGLVSFINTAHPLSLTPVNRIAVDKVSDNLLGPKTNEHYDHITRAHSRSCTSDFSTKEVDLQSASNTSSKISSILPLATYAGTYYNPGYGKFTLCAPDSQDAATGPCAQVLKDFVTVFPSLRDKDYHTYTNTLYSHWPRVWASHFNLTYSTHSGSDGRNHLHTFILTATALFPDGYGKNTKPFEVPLEFGENAIDVVFDISPAIDENREVQVNGLAIDVTFTGVEPSGVETSPEAILRDGLYFVGVPESFVSGGGEEELIERWERRSEIAISI